MGGFFGAVSANDCISDVFLEQIIIHTLVQDGAA